MGARMGAYRVILTHFSNRYPKASVCALLHQFHGLSQQPLPRPHSSVRMCSLLHWHMQRLPAACMRAYYA